MKANATIDTPKSAISERKLAYRVRARRAGLVYVNDYEVGITRIRRGKSFQYQTSDGRIVKSQSILTRIEKLRVPPAWREVWICKHNQGHIQARGLDVAGRIQSIYHERWSNLSSTTKYAHLAEFATVLPKIRRRVSRELSSKKITKSALIAAAIRIFDKAHIRIGNERYVGKTGARGATTLAIEHIDIEGAKISLAFPGKSGKWQEIEFRDQKVVRVIRKCVEIGGQYLFSYRDSEGKCTPITSCDINGYLQEITGLSISAKDFRTWWGTVTALEMLASDYDALTPTSRKRSLNAAIAEAAKCLGNTKAVCKSSYVHHGLMEAALAGTLTSHLERWKRKPVSRPNGLSVPERLLITLLPELATKRRAA